MAQAGGHRCYPGQISRYLRRTNARDSRHGTSGIEHSLASVTEDCFAPAAFSIRNFKKHRNLPISLPGSNRSPKD